MAELSDPAAERAVLAACFQHGAEAFADVADLVQTETFTVDSNQFIWKPLASLLQQGGDARPDLPSFLSAARTMCPDGFFDSPEERRHLRAVMSLPVELGNARKMAAKIRKLQMGREIQGLLKASHADVGRITGDESPDEILGLADRRTTEYVCRQAQAETEESLLAEGLDQYFEYLLTNPVDQVGLSSGWKRFDKANGGGFRPGTITVIGARMKVGKALSVDEIVQTPSGPKAMKEIKVGDLVCTPTGTSVVEGVYPQGELDIYRVVFAGGDSVECCDEHLWRVRHFKKANFEVLPLKDFRGELMSGSQKAWSVQMPDFCYRDSRPVPMDPYMLGVLIGDGGLTQCVSVTSADQEIMDRLSASLEPGYSWREHGKYGYNLTKGEGSRNKNRYQEILEQLGLFGRTAHHKFIPECYKYNSVTVRGEVLRGLMDTDGHVNEKGACEFTTASEQLAKDFKELVESLGGLCWYRSRYTTCNGKKFLSYRCRIAGKHLRRMFNLTRKKERCRERTKGNLERHIERVEYVGKKPAQCIKIEDPAGLFLTRHCIVTHNSQVGMNICNSVSTHMGVPVWYGDTELKKRDHWHRLMANLSDVPVDDVETGKFSFDPVKIERVRLAKEALKTSPYTHAGIAGRPFEETLARMRRWVMKKVGFDEHGKAKPCLLVFDYLKLMDTKELGKDLKETQVLGFMMTALHNFAVRYDVPVLVLVQLNRDGIGSEDTDAVGGSDRIAMLCSNLWYLKWQTDDERTEQGPRARYSHKLVYVCGRHGKGLPREDFIHMLAEYEDGRLTEGPTRSEFEADARKPAEAGVITEVPDDPAEV